MTSPLRRGTLAALATPFSAGGDLDRTSLGRLVRDAIAGGADGLVAPGEVGALSDAEREQAARTIAEVNRDALPWVLDASAAEVERVHRHAALARELGASACRVAVPPPLYARPEEIVPFFRAVAAGQDTPLLVDDDPPDGASMDIGVVRALHGALPRLAGLRVETGPPMTAVRNTLGEAFFLCGEAGTQMIEALDRGVHALVADGSTVRAAKAVEAAYREGVRGQAVESFRRFLPVLAFAGRDPATAAAFFKRLLHRKGLVASAATRVPFPWDAVNRHMADELIELCLAVEADLAG